MWQHLPRFVVDPMICKRARVHEFPMDQFVVRLAHTVTDYENAFKLLHVAYVYQGIESVRGSNMRVTPQHVLPETVVLVAYEGDKLVGTMSLTPDSPAGLPLDKDYPAEIAALRRKHQKLAEYGSLAVTKRYWHSGVTNLMNMAANRIAMQVFEASHVVIGINPKAAPFYRAMYNFTQFSRPQRHAELAAPVVGLVQELETLPAYLASHHTGVCATGHPVVRHFTTEPLPCIELPTNLSPKNLDQWRMSRAVFQELFFAKTHRLETLEPRVREYLEQRRSRETLTCPSLAARCPPALVA